MEQVDGSVLVSLPHRPSPTATSVATSVALFVAALIALFAAPVTVQAAEIKPEAVRSLAATCANCHGTNGRAVPGAGMASLAGMDRTQMLRALTEFRNGTRPATVMHQISKGYTEAQLEAIAGWFAAQK